MIMNDGIFQFWLHQLTMQLLSKVTRDFRNTLRLSPQPIRMLKGVHNLTSQFLEVYWKMHVFIEVILLFYTLQ